MSAATAQPLTPAHRRTLWPLWIMIAVFAAPILATWFYFFFPQYLPQTRSNRGEILNPPVPLPAGLEMTGPAGQPIDPAGLQGAWTLVYLTRGSCDPDCIRHLTEIRQIRLAVGQGRSAVGRLLLVAVPDGPLNLGPAAAAFEGMRLAQTDRAGLDSLLGALGTGAEGIGRLYILDPMGRLMMRYAPDAPPKDTLKDLERLLKGSESWIGSAQHGNH